MPHTRKQKILIKEYTISLRGKRRDAVLQKHGDKTEIEVPAGIEVEEKSVSGDSGLFKSTVSLFITLSCSLHCRSAFFPPQNCVF